MRAEASLGILFLASACAAVPSEPAPPVHGETGYVCDDSKAQRLVGQIAQTETGSEVLRLTGARLLRWMRPGDMVTMDFRQDRVSVELDSQNRVSRVRCG